MASNGRTFLIADGDGRVRAAERAAVSDLDDGEVVGEASTGPDAVEMAEALQPDVILIGARMPFLSGVEAIPAIRGRSPRSRIIVLLPRSAAAAGRIAQKLGARVAFGHPRRQLAQTLEAALEDRETP